MIRIIGTAFAGAIIGSFLTHGNQAAIWAGLIIFAAAAILPLATGRSALKCPHCRKRVKLGAEVCHHCGRTVARTPV